MQVVHTTGMVQIGDTRTAKRRFTQEDVETFAELSGDDNPLHMDEEYAEGARFGERIVHGTLVEGVISAALASFDGDVIYLDKDVSFVDPVYIGDTVDALVGVIDKEDGAYVCRVDAFVDEGPVVCGEATVLIE